MVEDGDGPHHRPPVPGQPAERHVEDPQQRAERRDLGARGHERGHRGRRALVDVRRPGVERHGADLEQQADAEQRDPDVQQRGAGGVGRGGRGDAPTAAPSRRSRTAARCRTGRTPTRTRRAGSTSAPPPATAAGAAGPGRTAGTAAATAPPGRRTWSAGRSRRGRAASRRRRTARAGRPRSARCRPAGPRAPRRCPARGRLRGERARRAGRRHSAISSTPTKRQQQDRALDEQGRAVHGDRADRGEAARTAVGEDRARGVPGWWRRTRPRGRPAPPRSGSAAAAAWHERLDQHPEHGGAEDDQHRRELAVVDVAATVIVEVARPGSRSRRAPLGQRADGTGMVGGTGSVECRPAPGSGATAGLMTSRTGLG